MSASGSGGGSVKKGEKEKRGKGGGGASKGWAPRLRLPGPWTSVPCGCGRRAECPTGGSTCSSLM